MKITAAKLTAFLNKPTTNIFLIYGPDTGLVRERCEFLAKQIVPDLRDPFSLTYLNGKEIQQDTAKFNDEIASQSLFGGQKVIWLQDITDSVLKHIEESLSSDSHNRVILEAGDLSSTSKLRKFFEKEKHLAAIPCYKDEDQNLKQVIIRQLHDAKMTIHPDALSYLLSYLGNDRKITRNEIDKIILYASGQSEITFEDVQNCAINQTTQSLDELVLLATEGRLSEMNELYTSLISENVQPIIFVRSLLRHMQKLYFIQIQIASGLTLPDAIAQLRPPVFFKFKPRFITISRKWSLKKCEQTLEALLELEEKLKSNHTPISLLSEQIYIKTCLTAQKPSMAHH